LEVSGLPVGRLRLRKSQPSLGLGLRFPFSRETLRSRCRSIFGFLFLEKSSFLWKPQGSLSVAFGFGNLQISLPLDLRFPFSRDYFLFLWKSQGSLSVAFDFGNLSPRWGSGFDFLFFLEIFRSRCRSIFDFLFFYRRKDLIDPAGNLDLIHYSAKTCIFMVSFFIIKFLWGVALRGFFC
jgi:hypothetical protein